MEHCPDAREDALALKAFDPFSAIMDNVDSIGSFNVAGSVRPSNDNAGALRSMVRCCWRAVFTLNPSIQLIGSSCLSE